jgi:hypothetical protein
VLAVLYGVNMVFVLHLHKEYWALLIVFAIYPFVPGLPQEPEVKPEKYTLFG